jgi:hypothetical protein
MHSIRNIATEHAKARPVLNLLQRIDKLKELNQRMYDLGMSRPTRDYKMRGFRDLIKAELIKEGIEEANRLQGQIEKLADAYHKDRQATLSTHIQELSLFQNKMSGSTDKELSEMAIQYIGHAPNFLLNPDKLDSLAAEIKTRDMPDYASLKNAMAEQKYEMPFIAQGRGKELYTEMMAWKRARPGEFPIQLEEGMGVLSLDDLLENDESQEAENATL